jgi:hypothetical protein
VTAPSWLNGEGSVRTGGWAPPTGGDVAPLHTNSAPERSGWAAPALEGGPIQIDWQDVLGSYNVR